MPDVFTKKKRSEIMSRIRSKGTKLELRLKEALEESGITFQYQPKLYGKPDFLIPPNITVFCDSSFWHGRNWTKLEKQLPKEYWRTHIKKNKQRDKIVNKQLREEGFIVLRFWDDQVERQLTQCLGKIRKMLKSQTELSNTEEIPKCQRAL
jgi:DNA mismatch endonuclease (patch repair protein)